MAKENVISSQVCEQLARELVTEQMLENVRFRSF